MRLSSLAALLVLGVATATLPACAPDTPAPVAAPSDAPEGLVTGDQGVAPAGRDGLGGPGASASPSPSPKPAAKALAAGNPNGNATVPAEARAVDTSKPTRTIGTGTPTSCTSAAVVKAVAAGGVITFDCGPAPVTIKMAATAKVRNANGPKVVLDGGGRVTLSGQGKRRILYMNTCDSAQGWTTSHCQNQDHPQLTVQNLTFADGNSTGDKAEGGGGGAIFVRGGRLKVVNSRFVDNRCDRTGPDLGGAAVRVLSQYDSKPVYVVGSTFDGGSCSNGGALSSIGVSWVVLNSLLRDNEAIGNGANPAKSGTPGGGSGGAIYCDGNEFTVRIAGTIIENNRANEGGGAVFFVSNDRTGTMKIEKSTLRRNPSGKFETRGYPGIFFLGARNPTVTNAKLT
ncbi:hypothetical protein ACFY2Q_01950 [Micromonospora sp. NPDC000316]|uniref:hypothetical protein n=1 Tax=Micromonospora sp. NPDC000316 TaxID=3364216 RepID=UPI00368DF5F6